MSNFKGDLVSLSKQIEIHPATGVEVDRIKWAYAQNSTSATTFVRQLLVALFPEDVLVMSNLRGGREREALDSTKLNAIYGIISALLFHLWSFPSVRYCITILLFCFCRSNSG